MGGSFAIEMLPGQRGDALWIEYGEGRQIHRVLVDGGTPNTLDRLKERIAALPPTERHLELLVVTHIDEDHIGGALRLLADTGTAVQIDDVWFNGWQHLPGTRRDDRLGPIDGEILTLVIQKRGIPWNKAFDGHSVSVGDDPKQALPAKTLPGGMRLTILSPGQTELAALKLQWRKVLHDAGLDGADLEKGLLEAMRKKGVPAPDALGSAGPNVERDGLSSFVPDTSVANGSGIALLAEYGGRSCLLAADAFAPVVQASLARLQKERGLEQLELTAVKLGHHGSKHNSSMPLVQSTGSRQFLISTDGSIFGHPDNIAIARLIKASPKPVTLYFNYRTSHNAVWDDSTLKAKYGYTTIYPDPASDGILRVEL
jgi:hypothetical protein